MSFGTFSIFFCKNVSFNNFSKIFFRNCFKDSLKILLEKKKKKILNKVEPRGRAVIVTKRVTVPFYRVCDQLLFRVANFCKKYFFLVCTGTRNVCPLRLPSEIFPIFPLPIPSKNLQQIIRELSSEIA